jgi:hypothetical protein
MAIYIYYDSKIGLPQLDYKVKITTVIIEAGILQMEYGIWQI